MTSDGSRNFDCTAARQYLSAFHDGEVATDLRSELEEHLAGCEQCAARLAEIREISRLARETPSPEVPADIWPQLERQLALIGSKLSSPRLFRRRRLLISSAGALVVVTASTMGALWLWNRGPDHDHVAINFGHYLEEYAVSPDRAEQGLLTNYAGRAVSYDEAAAKVRYQPATPEQLPKGLSRKALYLLHMPCCTCVQALYAGDNGNRLAIFEHVDDQPIWFGNRPIVHTRCAGKKTSLVEVDDHLAANWKCNGRFITVVGADDVEQISELVAYLDRKYSAKVTP